MPNQALDLIKTSKASDEIRSFPMFWWALRDSNPGPFGYEPNALTS